MSDPNKTAEPTAETKIDKLHRLVKGINEGIDRYLILFACLIVGAQTIVNTLGRDLASEQLFDSWFWSPLGYLAGVIWMWLGVTIFRDYIGKTQHLEALSRLGGFYNKMTLDLYERAYIKGADDALDRLEKRLKDKGAL